MNAQYLSLLLLFTLTSNLAAQEICNNGIDDDGNGLIDLNDPASCSCAVLNNGIPSLIPNASFEEQLCCPYGFVTPFSPPWLSCATGWTPGTQGTTDYFHTCGYLPTSLLIPPIPDGDGFVGGFVWPSASSSPYFEYIRRALDPGVLGPGSYVLEVWIAPTSSDNLHGASVGNYYGGEVNITLFGEPVAQLEPYLSVECLGTSPDWTELARTTLYPSTSWQRTRFEFNTSTPIQGIALGGSCDQPSTLQEHVVTVISGSDTTSQRYMPYVLYDDLTLNTSELFEERIERFGAWCSNDLQLSTALINGNNVGQWYRNGIALVGRTQPTLDLSGTGSDGGVYTFLQNSPNGCVRDDHELPMRPTIEVLSADTGIVPLEVTVSTGNGLSGTWDFGDGVQLIGSTVTHVYTEAGSYAITLHQDQLGCPTPSLDPAPVLALEPQDLFILATPQPTDVTNTLITLTGQGPEWINSWHWDLGDVPPYTAEGQEIQVEFPAIAGNYEVSLIAEGEFRDTYADTAHYTIVILSGMGVAEERLSQVVVLPNPVQDVLVARTTFRAERYEVLNSLGQVVMEGRIESEPARLGVQGLSQGTYVLQLRGENLVVHTRFIKR